MHLNFSMLQKIFYFSNVHIIKEMDNNHPLLENNTRVYGFEVVVQGEKTKRY